MAEVVDRAERLVRENRVTIAVVVPLVGALLLVGGTEWPLLGGVVTTPLFLLLGTFLMRLPVLVAVAPLVDRRAGGMLFALTGFTYAVEYVGVTTGWPYGSFRYLVELGPMLAGVVPMGLPLFFLPLVLDAFLLSLVVLGPDGRRHYRLAVTVGLVLLVDLVLDPGAVAVGFWVYDSPGTYYDVPLSNYVGWLLSGTVAVLGVEFAFDRSALSDRLSECEFALDDLASFVVFWGVVNLAGRNWIPVVLAGGIGLAVLVANGRVVPRGRRVFRSDVDVD